MNRLQIEMALKLNTAFHTTGNRRLFGVDKALSLNFKGNPVISATTVKGLLRDGAGTILRSWGHKVCGGPDPADMCRDSFCLLCKVFGNPAFASPLRFWDAAMEEPFAGKGEYRGMVRSGIGVSRHRRVVYPQRLFFTETTEPGPSRWRAVANGEFADEKDARIAAALVALGARWLVAAGAGRSRGLGWIEESEVKVLVDDTPLELEALASLWGIWKEGRDVDHA